MKNFLAFLTFLTFLTSTAFAQYIALDPTRYIPNARVLGLGKAYIGLADDVGSIYTNPAGMAEAPSWQLSSMSGKFLDEYNYLSFSGFYPTDFGVLGVGFAGTSISGAYATTIEVGSDPEDPIYTIDRTQTQMGNYNNAFIISYANEVDRIGFLKQLPLADRLALGANFKIFRAALYGDGIVNGDASGYEMDLGVKLYPPQKWMKFGVTVQNLLPTGLGGKLTYTSGHEESYPAIVEVGSAFKILGKEDSLLEVGDHDLKFMLDFDYHPTLKNYPLVLHTGLEWRPISLVALRAALDQDAAADGYGGLQVLSDVAFGVGLYYAGFRFDYAYRTFAGAPNIDNHFFSLSYGFNPPPVEIKEKMVVDEPADKLVTFAEEVKVSGNILDPKARTLKINGALTKFGLKGEFQSDVKLKLGKNRIVVGVFDGANRLLQINVLRALRLYTYPDVPQNYWVAQPISLLAMQEIITGYPDGTFRPEGNITRAEMCSLLMKSRGTSLESRVGPEAQGTRPATFKDVSANHWAAPYIAQAAAEGIVKGYPGNVFKPNGKITRAEGLAMIARFAGISEGVYQNEFSDISNFHWISKIAAGAYKAGILEFLKGKRFEANKLLTRAETVEMLYRTQVVKDILAKDLLNWETY